MTSTSYYQKYSSSIKMGLGTVLICFFGFLAVYGIVVYYINSSYKMARLEIEIDGKTRVFEGEVINGMTVLEALQSSALAGNMALEYDIREGQLIIKSIDGHKSIRSETISFYLNSKPIDTQKIYSIPINQGDILAVKIK